MTTKQKLTDIILLSREALWEFFHDEHGTVLTDTELNDTMSWILDLLPDQFLNQEVIDKAYKNYRDGLSRFEEETKTV